jgi:hypothetical protein
MEVRFAAVSVDTTVCVEAGTVYKSLALPVVTTCPNTFAIFAIFLSSH